MGVAYADPTNGFAGHGACGTAGEWINAIVDGPNGDGDFHRDDPPTQLCILWDAVCPSRGSFHPKAAGTSGYATVVTDRLNAIGYHGS